MTGELSPSPFNLARLHTHPGTTIPSPRGWVIAAVYADRIVWALYPSPVGDEHTLSDCVLNTSLSSETMQTLHSHMLKTAVLDVIWPSARHECESPSGIRMQIGSDVVFQSDIDSEIFPDSVWRHVEPALEENR